MANSSRSKFITIEQGLFGIIFLIALFLRLFRLGSAALNDGEAYWALQALDLAHGNFSFTSGQPGYTVLTGLLFFLIDDSNTWARMLPALSGSLLVWLPLAIRPALRDTPLLRRLSLLLAIALAIEPALVGLSRQAGSLMTGLSFSLLAIAFWFSGRSILAGLFAGIAILSGPGLLHGLLGLALALLVANFLKVSPFSSEARITYSSSRSTLLSAALTILLVATCFGLYPRGLAGLAETLGLYLQTWMPAAGNIPDLNTPSALSTLPLAILLYQPLAVIFGAIAGVRSWIAYDFEEAGLGRFLGIWVLTSFLLTLLAPGRQVVNLAWTLVPLWALAAMELARYDLPAEWYSQRWIFRGAALLFGFFLVLAGYYFLYLNVLGAQPFLQAAMLAGIAIMALIVAMLFAAGWNLDITRIGLVWGVSFVLALWMLSPTWGLSQLRPNGAAEYWRVGPAAGQVEDLTNTLHDLAAWDTGVASLMEIQSTVNSPALRWALRDFSPITYTAGLAKDQLPAAFITSESTQSPELLASYRGQDFDWEITPGWTGALPPYLLDWLYLRKAPITTQKIILWVRADLFPSGELNP